MLKTEIIIKIEEIEPLKYSVRTEFDKAMNVSFIHAQLGEVMKVLQSQVNNKLRDEIKEKKLKGSKIHEYAEKRWQEILLSEL